MAPLTVVSPATALRSAEAARRERATRWTVLAWLLAFSLGWVGAVSSWWLAGAFVLVAAASAHLNGLIGAEVARRRELHRDLQAARRIQQSLLPSGAPPLRHLDVAVACRMCRDVGGDCVDWLSLGEERLLVLVADVSGKGIAAALVMTALQASFRTLAASGCSLASLAEALDRQLLAQRSDRYATAILLLLDSKLRHLEYVNAGHLPMAVATAGGEVVTLDSTGPPLGLLPGVARSSARFDLDQGGAVVIVTDGITERGGDHGEFGFERVVSLVARAERSSASALVDAILSDNQRHAEGAPAEDDLTVLAIRLETRSIATADRQESSFATP